MLRLLTRLGEDNGIRGHWLWSTSKFEFSPLGVGSSGFRHQGHYREFLMLEVEISGDKGLVYYKTQSI